MASSGIVNSLTFTPDSDGQLVVTCTYSCGASAGADWSSGTNWSACFCTQDSVTTYGPQLPMTTTRAVQIARFLFDVVAGSEITCGLFGNAGTVSSVGWYEIDVIVELIKR